MVVGKLNEAQLVMVGHARCLFSFDTKALAMQGFELPDGKPRKQNNGCYVAFMRR